MKTTFFCLVFIYIFLNFNDTYAQTFKTEVITWNNVKTEVVQNEVIVKLKSEYKYYNSIIISNLENEGYKVFKGIDKLSIMKIKLTDNKSDLNRHIENLNNKGIFEFVEPNFVGHTCVSPNDPHFNKQYGLSLINSTSGWEITQGNSNVIIGILDSGIPLTNGTLSHPDLSDNTRITLGADVVGDGEGVKDFLGHGTHVAGIISAESNNSIGVVGLSWNTKLYIVQVFDNLGYSTSEFFLNGVVDAIDNGNTRIINFSGGWVQHSGLLELAVNYANNNNTIIVASAGNENSNILYPARYALNYNNVISVGATDNRDARATFSNYGQELTVVAPGVDIYSTVPDYWTKSYDYKTGTSMSAPLVSGLCGLILSINPYLNPIDVKNYITNNALKVPYMGNNNFSNAYGYGRIDAFKTISKVLYDNGSNNYLYDIKSGLLSKTADGIIVEFYRRPIYNSSEAAGRYRCDRYEVTVNINKNLFLGNFYHAYTGPFGYNISYAGQGNSALPAIQTIETNDGYQYKTWFYYIRQNLYGTNINKWAPFNPNSLGWYKEYTILGDPISPPSISSIIQSPSPLYKGQSGTITCNASGDNLTYSWTVQSQPDFITLGSLSGPSLAVSNIATYNKYSKDNLYFGPPQDLIVTCTVSNPAGSVYQSFTANVIPGDPPGGGCPFLFVQSDNGYVMDNNLLHRSEFEGNAGKDIKDVYKLKVNPVADKNKLKFQIKELNHDHSYFDRIKLYSVDHPSGTEVGVTENNDIVLYLPGGVVSTSNAVLNDKNITNLIQYNLKSPGVEGVSKERIFMNFDTKKLTSEKLLQTYNTDGSTDSMAMIMNIEGIGSTPIDPKEMAGTIDGNEAAEKTLNRGFARREKQSVVIVPLGNNVSLDSLNIEWFRDYDMQYAAATPVLYGGYEKKELNLIEAVHTIHGNIKQQLNKIDQSYAELDTNGFITLTFNSGGKIKSGWVRSYIIEVDGYYLPPGEQGKNGSECISIQKESLSGNSLPVKYELGANYPNPFNPTTTIEYAVPSEGQVTVKVYDILGREVVTLVNEYQSPGRYKVTWNAAGMPSGLYIYRMTAKDFNSVRKMLLIK